MYRNTCSSQLLLTINTSLYKKLHGYDNKSMPYFPLYFTLLYDTPKPSNESSSCILHSVTLYSSIRIWQLLVHIEVTYTCAKHEYNYLSQKFWISIIKAIPDIDCHPSKAASNTLAPLNSSLSIMTNHSLVLAAMLVATLSTATSYLLEYPTIPEPCGSSYRDRQTIAFPHQPFTIFSVRVCMVRIIKTME